MKTTNGAPPRNAAAVNHVPPDLDGSNRHGYPLERLLSAREVGEILGFTAGTIVDWSERNELPSFKVGGRLRFRESEIAAWIEAQRRAA